MADVCNLCGKPANSMCQRCNETYCSTNCQILDWRVHKKVCFQMPILIPIKELGHRDANSSFNRSFGGDSSRNRTPCDKNVKRPLARNPLKISDEDSPPPMVNTGSPDPSLKNHRSEVDFTLKPKVVTPDSNVKQSSTKSMVSQSGARNAAWKTAYTCPEGVFFEVMVQYVDIGKNEGIIWVTELKYEGPLRKLLAEINRNIDINSARCSDEEICTGSLIAAPFDNLYYRAEILNVQSVSKTVYVHLIDYGNIVEVPFKDLRSPIPIMKNLNAYAFRIMYNKPVDLETVLTIRVIDYDKGGEVAIVEEKPSNINLKTPIGLTAEAFADSATVTLVKLSQNGKFALLRLQNEHITKELSNMDTVCNGDAASKLRMENTPKDGDYVAARTLHGWSRGVVINTYRKDYLVYLLDVGRIALVEHVMTVAQQFNSIPMQVFAVELQTVLSGGNTFAECLSHDKIFTIKAQTIAKARNDRIPCSILTSEGSKVAEVEAFNYLGKCNEFNMIDWVEPLLSGSAVHVTSVVSHSEVFISLVCTKLYPKIFSAAAEDCEPLASGKLEKGNLVLAKANDMYFRAKIIDAAKIDAVKVLNVDTGNVCTVSGQTMRKPNMFVLSCPYHTRRVKLMYLSNVATPYADNKALAMLEQCEAKGAEFTLKFDTSPELGVELLMKTAEQQSFNKQLLPMLFEKRTDIVKEIIPNVPEKSAESIIMATPPPSPKVVEPPSSSSKLYTLKDLEVMPITCGNNVSVMVLDSSTISKGYITACDFTNTDFLKKLESEYLPKVAKHCAGQDSKAAYSPRVDELCLAVYDADKEWYRAMCLDQLKDDMFYVMFLDYGNLCRVHKNNIRQMAPELMFPSNANMVIFEGLPDNVPQKMCEKFLMSTQTDPIIIGNVSKIDQDSYSIRIQNKDKYF